MTPPKQGQENRMSRVGRILIMGVLMAEHQGRYFDKCLLLVRGLSYQVYV